MLHYAAIAVRALIVAVFVASLWSKVRSRDEFRAFADSISPLPMVRPRRSRLVAHVVVVAEGLIIGLTAIPASAGFGMAVAAGLLGTFAMAIAVTVRRGVVAVCRCFGPGGGQLRRQHVVRNALLAVVAAAGAAAALARPTPGIPLMVTIVLAAAGVVGAVVVVLSEQIVELFQPLTEPTSGVGRPAGR
jgi:hypothetical protein